MNDPDPLSPVLDALLAEQIEFMLVGSYSSNAYGIPRQTKDADIVVNPAGKAIGAIAARLPAGYKLDPQIQFEGVTGTTRNVISIAGSQFVIELFRLGSDPHDQERFRRRRVIQFEGRAATIATAEDVIIMKLRWARRKDLDDIQAVLALQQSVLDWDYIYHWCDIHGTRAQLEDLRRELPPNID